MARTPKTPAPVNTELSAALTSAEQARTELATLKAEHLAMTAQRNALLAMNEGLEEKLAIAREKYVVMRDIIRELRAPRAVSRPMTDAQVRYAQRAAEGRAMHEANAKRHRTMVAAYVAAHPGAPYTMPQVEAWYAQPAPVDCE